MSCARIFSSICFALAESAHLSRNGCHKSRTVRLDGSYYRTESKPCVDGQIPPGPGLDFGIPEYTPFAVGVLTVKDHLAAEGGW
jgi:hypothetical protein